MGLEPGGYSLRNQAKGMLEASFVLMKVM